MYIVWIRGVAQAIECLLCKQTAMSPTPVLPKRKTQKNKKVHCKSNMANLIASFKLFAVMFILE
jgi:hypothetical protein